MAAFNFPANPTEGQVFTPPGGPTYIFRVPTWLVSSPANNNYVKIAGDTMTGDLNIRKVAPEIRLDGTAANDPAHVQFQLQDKLRWNVGMNPSQQFEIGRFDVSGNYVDTPVVIDPNNGAFLVQDAFVVNRGQPVVALNRPNVSAPAQISSMVGFSDRWIFTLGNTEAEGAGNSGNNVELAAFGNNGAYIGSPLKVGRGNMLVELGGDVIANGFLYARQGVQFSNLNSDPAALDYYGEGAWVPALRFGGNGVGVTYSLQSGRYVRIGALVVARGQLTLSAKGTSTGVATIIGLPFSAATLWGLAHFGYAAGMTGIIGAPQGIVTAPGTTFRVTGGSAASTIDLNDTNFANNTNVVFQAIYETQG